MSYSILAALLFVVVQVYSQTCDTKTIIDLGWGQKNPIPLPTAVISYDSDNQRFNFAVNTTYLGENYAWVVDFESWAADSNRSINLPNSCENRKADSFSGSFSSWWSSADNALSPGALNTLTYLPYGPANSWTQQAISCDAVNFARSFGVADLVGCTGSKGANLITPKFNDNQTFTYTGVLYVTAVKPKNLQDLTAGYSNIEFAFPFEFTFYSYIDNIVSQYQDAPFTVNIIGMSLDDQNRLQLKIETSLESRDGTSGNYVTGTSLVTPTGFATTISETSLNGQNTQGASLLPCVMNAAGQCKQDFTIVSVSSISEYSGNYQFSWNAVECIGGVCQVRTDRPVIATVPIHLSIIGKQGGTARSLQTSLTTFDGVTKTARNTAFYSGETLVIRDALQVQPVDANQFTIMIQNAWICFSPDANWVPALNETNGQYGCSKPYGSLTQNNIVQLIANNVSTSTSAVQKAFQTNIITQYNTQYSDLFPYSSTIGFSIAVQPISTVKVVYWIEVDTLIVSVSGQTIRSRSIKQSAPASQTITKSSANFEFQPLAVYKSSASTTLLSGLVLAIITMISVLML